MALSVVIFLWAVNFAPPLAAYFLESKWGYPLDGGLNFFDGQPLLGRHKTLRGLFAALATGMLAGYILGWGWWLGFLAAMLSMCGDLGSSFLKRRLKLPSGSDVPGLDQFLEGIFPLFLLKFSLHLSWLFSFFLLILFCVGAFAGSKIYKSTLLKEPFSGYPRPLRARVRFRELTSCKIQSPFWARIFNFEEGIYYHLLIYGFFRLTGLYERGKKNALKFGVKELQLGFANLPASFDGYKILFMSDLHLDGLSGVTERLIGLLSDKSFDLCILGGDYRMFTFGEYSGASKQLQRLVQSICARDGIYAVLGNHDCLEMVDALRKSGVEMLINDSACLEKDGEFMQVVGVDDPHYYRCHDLKQAFKGVSTTDFSLFVAHSPVLYRDVLKYEPELYLAGHTHAGQVQIPRLGMIFTHCPTPRKYCQGVWKYKGILGYTSSGVGVSGVPVRFYCQGELVVLTLKKDSEQSIEEYSTKSSF